MSTTYIDYPCHSDAILRFLGFLDCKNYVHAVLCHLFRCFDPRFKDAFIIRDINSCRKGYSKGRIKSRESDHFSIQFAFSSITTSAILNLDVEKSAATLLNPAATSCISSRIVLLNVDKDGGMFFGGFC